MSEAWRKHLASVSPAERLVALDQRVWCPSLQQVAGKTPSPPSFERTRRIRHHRKSQQSHHPTPFGGGRMSKLGRSIIEFAI